MRVIERHQFGLVAGGGTPAGITPAQNVQHTVNPAGQQVYTWSTPNNYYSYVCSAPVQAGVTFGMNAQGKIALTAGGNVVWPGDCTTYIENKATGVITRDDGHTTTVINPNNTQHSSSDSSDPGDSNFADGGDSGSGVPGDDGSGGYAGGPGDGDGGGVGGGGDGGGGGGGDDYA